MLSQNMVDVILTEIKPRIDVQGKVVPTDDELLILIELASTNNFYRSLNNQYLRYGHLFQRPFAYLYWEIKQRGRTQLARGSAPPADLKFVLEGDIITTLVRISEVRELEWNRQVWTFNSAKEAEKKGTYYIGFSGDKEIQFWGYSSCVKNAKMIPDKTYQITGKVRTVEGDKIILNYITSIKDATQL